MRVSKTLAEWCLANVVTTKARLAEEPKGVRNTYTKHEVSAEVEMICHCGVLYTTTKSELRKGWGLSCSRKCAARRTRLGLNPGKRLK